jgi:cytidyltransferase-like protein
VTLSALPRRTRVVTSGTFGGFQAGHLRLQERTAALGDELVVGVRPDALDRREEAGRRCTRCRRGRRSSAHSAASTRPSSSTAWTPSGAT